MSSAKDGGGGGHELPEQGNPVVYGSSSGLGEDSEGKSKALILPTLCVTLGKSLHLSEPLSFPI